MSLTVCVVTFVYDFAEQQRIGPVTALVNRASTLHILEDVVIEVRIAAYYTQMLKLYFTGDL